MKKANELNIRFNAKVAVFIQEDGESWIYQSDNSWPSIPSIVLYPISLCKGRG
jgi:hypothetical protein